MRTPPVIQFQMAQKRMLGDEVGARALRVRSVPREDVWASAGVQSARPYILERIEGRLGAADSGYGPPCRDIKNEAAVTHVTGRGASTSGPVGAPFDVNASFDELLCELRSMHSFTARANCLASLILNHPNYPGSLETICATKDVVKLGNYVSGRINVYIFIPRRRDPKKDNDPYEWVDRRPLVLSLSKKNTGEPAPLEELRKVRAKFDGSRYVLKPYSPGHFPCTIQHSK